MNQSESEILRGELARIWQDALEVDRVEPNDDFFEMGGHSLLSLGICEQVRKLLHAPALKLNLFTTPTVASMSDAILSQLGLAVAV